MENGPSSDIVMNGLSFIYVAIATDEPYICLFLFQNCRNAGREQPHGKLSRNHLYPFVTAQ